MTWKLILKVFLKGAAALFEMLDEARELMSEEDYNRLKAEAVSAITARSMECLADESVENAIARGGRP